MCASRLYIIDEHDTVRAALAEYLDRASNLTVIGHSADATESVEAVKQTQPDVVLVEVKRSDGLGLEIVRQISRLPFQPRLIVLTSYPTQWEEEASARAGAGLYVLKDIKSDELILKISEIMERA